MLKIMKKRIILFTVLVLGLSTLGFGCKKLTKEEEAAVKPITLDYWTVFNDVDELRALAARYKQVRPYVTVKIRQVRYDEFDRLFTNALADGVGPDLVSVHNRWLGRYRSRLSVMPKRVRVSRLVLKSKFNKELEVLTDTLQMPSLQSINTAYVRSVPKDVVRGDAVYGLPIAFDTLAIYYNKDLLDKSGVAEPPGTWDAFASAVEKISKQNAQGEIVQSGVALGTSSNIDNAFDIVSLLMMQNGVEMQTGSRVTFSDGLNRGRNTHPAMQAMRFYTDFADSLKKAYSWNENMENAFDAFVRGKSAFYFGFAYDKRRLEARAPGINLGVIAVPQLNTASPSNVANYWIEAVTNQAEYKNEAWDFVRFLTAPDTVKKYTDATLQPSPLRVHNAEQLQNPDLAPFASQVLFAENWYTGNDVAVAEEAFDTMVSAFLLEPGDGEDKLKRNVNLIIDAARVVQQTVR